MFPACHPVGSSDQRYVLNLVKGILQGNTNAATGECLPRVVNRIQGRFDDYVAKCAGRSPAHRRRAFLRLQRVRHTIDLDPSASCNIERFAAMANYEKSHFIRRFREVFGETPYAYALRRRLTRARELLETTPLAISDIARTTGFRSDKSFFRAFTRRFGRSAMSLRRE
jgi:AraC family transcriptional regulator